MIKEFEGKSEREAIEKAVQELGLESTEFDVEIIPSESKKGFLFKKQMVRIRVHVSDNVQEDLGSLKNSNSMSEHALQKRDKAVSFLSQIIEHMGYTASINIEYDDKGYLHLHIISDEAAMLIGRKGKNLDALQLLVSVYLNTIFSKEDNDRVIVDAENYRQRRTEIIQHLAIKNANLATKQRKSRLLEPMNPFERRIVHTTLSERNDVITQSEGDGLYKQVRIIYRGYC